MPGSATPDLATRAWSFEAFDRAVRAEMERRERAAHLPTLSGVLKRYKCKTIGALAAKLGLMFAPKLGRPSANGNGREPRRRL